jgi:hypothetical protein
VSFAYFTLSGTKVQIKIETTKENQRILGDRQAWRSGQQFYPEDSSCGGRDAEMMVDAMTNEP